VSDFSIINCRPCGYEKRARDVAKALRAELAVEAEPVPGSGGVFEIKVGDKTVVKRAKGHFPDTAQVVAAVAAAR
jgi:selenoprotein W-related protein